MEIILPSLMKFICQRKIILGVIIISTVLSDTLIQLQ
jgi:hypothetical protein